MWPILIARNIGDIFAGEYGINDQRAYANGGIPFKFRSSQHSPTHDGRCHRNPSNQAKSRSSVIHSQPDLIARAATL